MLAITQFEVYVYQKGRWTIHARYAGEDRNEAVLDARTTESATGFPSKVIRETYFPEVNDSERITVYSSPKIKEQQAQLLANARRRTPLKAARDAAANALARRGRVRTAQPRLTAGQMVFRVIVAGGISLAAATLVTGVVAWALRYVADSGATMEPDTRTMVLTYSYVLAFLFFFWSLFRSKLPLHRLLADLWQKASKAQTAAVPMADAKPPRVKPKHDRPPSPEVLREWEDLKVKRGDLDPAKAEEIAEVEMPAVVAPLPVTPPEPPKTEAEVAKAKAEAKKKEKEEQKRQEAIAAATAKAEADAKIQAEAAAAAEEPRREALNLERMVLRRFATDIVKPALSRVMPDDPVSRRGTALVLSGGAAGVAATAHLDARAELELLSDALQHLGLNQGSVDLFMSHRAEHINAPANASLLAAGRNALVAYLEGAADVAATLARAMIAWRTPIGHAPVPDDAFSGAPHFDAAPLLEVYVMTELRENQPAGATTETAVDAFHDQAMGAHNGVVRAAITAHGGHEVKHTGKGIFARFATARTAVDAAIDMQRGFTDPSSKLAIGVIGNTTAGEDPTLSSNLVHQAQDLLARTGTGEILCEAQVQAAIRHQQSEADTAAANRGSEDLDFGRVVVPEASFETSPVRNHPAA